MTKREQRVYDYIEKHGSITVKECTDNLGTSECRKIISNIREAGIPIVSEWEKGKNRFGEETRYKRYFIKGLTSNND